MLCIECGEIYKVILRSAHSHSATMMKETLLLMFLLTHAAGTKYTDVFSDGVLYIYWIMLLSTLHRTISVKV